MEGHASKLKTHVGDMNIKPYPQNGKKHPKKQIEQIAASIKEFGFNQPIVVDKEGTIIVGHGRYEASKLLGIENPPTITVDLTEEQAKAYRLADNKLNESEWDMNLVIEELKGLSEPMLELTGFDKDLIIEPDEQDDVVPDVPEEPQSKLGDLYELGNHRVLCGDSTKIEDVERLMDGKKADMVFTDPPYGIGFIDTKGNSIQGDDISTEQLRDFNVLWQRVAFEVSASDVFMMVWQSPRLFVYLDLFSDWKFFRLITMYKPNRMGFPHGAWINVTEPCLVFSKGKPKITKKNYVHDCFVYKYDKESHDDSDVGHPTPKPVSMVIEQLQAVIGNNQIVLDLFLGSGSTLIAAEKTGRICYGMELDPKYVDVIVKRWEDYTGKKAIKHG